MEKFNMVTYCENCGCKVFDGFCINCHEEIYIEEQYIDLDMPVPEIISEKANEFREEVKRMDAASGGNIAARHF